MASVAGEPIGDLDESSTSTCKISDAGPVVPMGAS